MLIYSVDDQAFVNGPDPVGAATAAVLAEIEKYAADLRLRSAAGLSILETSQYDRKARQARDFQSNPIDASAPQLALEASTRGITTASLVTAILTNSIKADTAEARIAGQAGRHKDAVRALVGRAAVLAYDWRGGWPEV